MADGRCRQQQTSSPEGEKGSEMEQALGLLAVGDLDLLGHWVGGSAVGGSQVCQGV